MNRAAVSAVRIGSAKRDRWLLHPQMSQQLLYPFLQSLHKPLALVLRRYNHTLCRNTLPQLKTRFSLLSTCREPDFSISHDASLFFNGTPYERLNSIRKLGTMSAKRHFHTTIYRPAADDNDASKATKPKEDAATTPKDKSKTESPSPKSGKKDGAKSFKDKPSEKAESKSSPEVRKVDMKEVSPKLEGGPPIVDGVRQYTTPELNKDAAFHKAGLEDPTRPTWQNPLHHNNPDFNPKFFREEFASDEEFEAAVQPAPPLDLPDGTPSYPLYLLDLADDMVNLTMLEMNELINYMADHYGFDEGVLSPEGVGEEDAGGDDGDGGAPPPEAEKTAFDVKLVSFDSTAKIKIIKEVRVVVPGLGLKEAKEMVEGAPVVLQSKVSKEVAEQSKEKLEALGAVIEIV